MSDITTLVSIAGEAGMIRRQIEHLESQLRRVGFYDEIDELSRRSSRKVIDDFSSWLRAISADALDQAVG